MVSPLAIGNRGDRQVVVYAPGRAVAPTRRTGAGQQAAPPRRLPSGGAGRAINSGSVAAEAFANRRVEQRQEELKDEAWNQLPWYKQGLGMVLGNPVVKNALVPLNAIDTGRKAVVLGIEELAEAMEGGPEWIKGPITDLISTERTEADKRSNWEKLSLDSDYGFGQLLSEDNPKWLNNVLGFAGDVAFDPTTYLSGGTLRLASGAAKAGRAAKIERAFGLADNYLADAAKAAEAGDMVAATTARKLAAESETKAYQLQDELAELAAQPDRVVPLRQGRRAREQFLGELAEENPALVERHADALKRGAERGFNTIRDEELREALGLMDPRMRWMGMNIPGTERLAYRGAAIGGGARAAANRTPLLGKTMARFTPRGLEEASQTLSRGAEGNVLRSATMVRIQNLMRRATGMMEGRGNRELSRLARSLKSFSNDEIRSLFRQAEANPEANIFNEFFGKVLPGIYEEVAGIPMGVKRDPDTYVPHMMKPQFKRFLAANAKNESVEDYMRAAGFNADDLLEGSHHLDKARLLQPDEVGVPKDFQIAGQKITLKDGTIDELNDELAKAFPDFKGKFYEDDPMRIGEAYINSVARQAGRDFALGRMATSENALVRSVTGEVAESLKIRNEFLRQNPLTEMIKKGYTKGQRLSPVAPKGEMPTTAHDELFALTKAIDETQQQRNLLMQEGKQFVAGVAEDVKPTRKRITDTLKDLRTQLMNGLEKKAGAAERQIAAANKVLGAVDDELKKMGPLSSENVDELVALSTTVDQKIVDVRAEIKKIQDRYGSQLRRDQAKIKEELDKTLTHLEAQAESIKAKYRQGPADIRKEALERKRALEAPIEAATTAREQAEARYTRPVSRERVQAANAFIRSDFVSEEAYELERQTFLDALHQMREEGMPIQHKVDGRLTDETVDAVQRRVSEIKATQPPPAAGVAQPPAAAVPEPPAPPPPTPPAPAAAPDLQAQLATLNRRYKDAVADGDEALADQIEAEIDRVKAAAPAPEPPPAAAAPPEPPAERRPIGGIGRRQKRSVQGANIYDVTDGVDWYEIRKNDDGQWEVKTEGQRASTKTYRTLAQAEAAIDRGEHRAAAAAAAAVEPPAAAAETAFNKLDKNRYETPDGDYEVTKVGSNWQVLLYGEMDVGSFPSLKKAGEFIAEDRRTREATRSAFGQGAAPAAAPAAAVPPAAVEPPVAPAVEAAAPAAAEEAAAAAPRRRWVRKELFEGREKVLVGPEGWSIEPFEEWVKRHPGEARVYMAEGLEGPRAVTAPLSDVMAGPRRVRYIAYNAEGDRSLVGRTFASVDEAKRAAEEAMFNKPKPMTMAELEAASEKALPKTAMVNEVLSNQRVFPPSELTPEQAAANRAAAEAAPQQVRPPSPREPYTPPAYEFASEEDAAKAAQLAELQAATMPTAERPYVYPQDYRGAFDEWKAMEDRAVDPSLTAAQRRDAARKAKSMGGQFTKTTGKWHERWSAERVMQEDLDWQRRVDADPQVQAARAAEEKAKNDALNQVEAMVYVKHHNPITGTDEYTRLPQGSTFGFGYEQGERTVVPIEVPTQGDISPLLGPEPRGGGWESRYDEGSRVRDRAKLDDPSMRSSLMMPEHSREYNELSDRSLEIQDQLRAADANQANIERLDEAAKAAYTAEVKAADDAVLEAKKRLVPAEMAYKANQFGSKPPYDEAKRIYDAAVENQTRVRQQWMEADRALKDALAQREDYLRNVRGEVSRAEQAALGFRNDAQDALDKLRGVPTELSGDRTRPPIPYDEITMRGGVSKEFRQALRNVQQADEKLKAAHAAGVIYLTDAEKRRLVGELNGIDIRRRELFNADRSEVERVQRGTDVVPKEMWEEEVYTRPEALIERGEVGLERRPQNIPIVRGQEDALKARAYAESFEGSQPVYRPITSVNEEGIEVEKLVPGGTSEVIKRPQGKKGPEELRQVVSPTLREPYTPRTEYEAIAGLQQSARDLEKGVDQEALNRDLANISWEMTGRRTQAETNAGAAKLASDVARDEKLLPLRDQVETYNKVNQALNDKAKMIPQRDAAKAQRKTIVENKVSAKADLVTIANDIEVVAKQNPELLDKDLATVEGLLQDVRDEATRVTDNDLTAKQVQGAIDKVGDKKDQSLDIMLTTVGRNWKMLYETGTEGGTLLKEGDIIVQADLHRMFTNLYDISKDRVLFGRTLNAFTNLFKTYATLTPGFHVRNALSAIFMNSTDGVPMMTQLTGAQLWRQYMDGGEEWLKNPPAYKGFTSQQIKDAFAAAHGSGAGGRFEEAGFAELETIGASWLDWMEKLSRNKLTRASQRLGSRVEGSVRLGMALDSMKLGENVESAVQRINRIHFDYGEISKLDDNAKRLIPFWTFMSRNMPMQVSQMWTHPATYAKYNSFIRNFRSEDEEYTPAYWTKAGAFNTGLKIPENNLPVLGAASGLPLYVSPDLGFTRLQSDLQDYQDFLSGKRPGAVLSQGNPWFTAPLEFAFRQDIFTGQRFEKNDTVPVGGLNAWIKALAIPAGQYDWETGQVDAAFANSLRAVNPLADRSARLLPQATGGDEEGMKRQLESILRTGLGAPVRTLTPKQQDNEYYRRYYDLIEEAKRQQQVAQLQAAG